MGVDGKIWSQSERTQNPKMLNLKSNCRTAGFDPDCCHWCQRHKTKKAPV